MKKGFPNFRFGGHLVQQRGTIRAILDEGNQTNNPVKLFRNPLSHLEKLFKANVDDGRTDDSDGQRPVTIPHHERFVFR